jgi:hypothetical protein
MLSAATATLVLDPLEIGANRTHAHFAIQIVPVENEHARLSASPAFRTHQSAAAASRR